MLHYPAQVSPDSTGFMVSFRDIPEALTCGETYSEAQSMAADALLTAMEFYFEDRRTVPLPSALRKNEILISLPASISAKILLLNEMITQGITPSELAHRMNTRKQEVNRIIDINHSTKIDTIADALACMGRELELSVHG